MGGKRKVEPEPTPISSPSSSVDPVPMPTVTETPLYGIRFKPIKGHTQKDLERVKSAEAKINAMVKSECFEKFLLARPMIQTEGRTNAEVIAHLRQANLEVPVVMYYKNNRVVGYRQPPSPTIYTNRKFHAGTTPCNAGSNLFHEWSHSLVYGHSFKATRSRPYSVPYSLNAVVSKCCL
jgi:hypothetical protein